MLEDYDDRTSRYELDYIVRTASSAMSRRRSTVGGGGSLTIALPRLAFSSGADLTVTVSPAGVATVKSRMVYDGANREVLPKDLRTVVSHATVYIVQVRIEVDEDRARQLKEEDDEENSGDVEVELRVEPGPHGVVLNGEPVERRR